MDSFFFHFFRNEFGYNMRLFYHPFFTEQNMTNSTQGLGKVRNPHMRFRRSPQGELAQGAKPLFNSYILRFYCLY